MKSIIKITLTILTCLLVFSSCCEKQNADEPKHITITYERAVQLQKEYIRTRANFLNTYLDSINHFERSKEENELNDEIEYDNNGQNENENEVKKSKERAGFTENMSREKKNDSLIEDTRDVTFSIDDLKQYIAYVEKIANKKGLKGLGLRFYFGAYPKNDPTPNIKYPGYTTLFFMPTHQVESDSNSANKFFYFAEDQLMENVNPGNLGHAGSPPRDNDLKE